MTIPHSTLRRTLLATFATSAVLLAGCASMGAGHGGKTPGTMNAATLQKLDELCARFGVAHRRSRVARATMAAWICSSPPEFR